MRIFQPDLFLSVSNDTGYRVLPAAGWPFLLILICELTTLYTTSLVTRPGFSFKEPRRAASAGLVRKVKIYHISSELRDLDGFGGARWRNNSIPQ